MRNPLGPVVVALGGALALAGCASTPAAVPDDSPPAPLTASAALGEFTTLDYCSLLDVNRLRSATADQPDSSFDACHGEFIQNGRRRQVVVGPLAADSDPNVKPYDYAGAIPDGLAVAQSSFNAAASCGRVITFADGIRLNVAVTDTAGPSASGDRCADADAAVGGVLAAISGKQVRHQAFADRSWGRVDACALLSAHDLDATSGAGAQPSGGLSGHSCIRGRVSVKFSVEDSAPTGPAELLGGRTSRVSTDGAFCRVTTVQPAPGAAGRSEQAEVDVVDTSGSTGDAACPDARTAAAVVFAKIP